MRVVLDTNILISACWKPGGLESRVLELVLEGRLIACVTDALLEEYRDVQGRKKFAHLSHCFAQKIAELQRLSLCVTAQEPVHAASDEDDNRILECALAAKATYVITGNLRDYPEEFRGIFIRNARQFLEAAGFLEPDSGL